MPSPLTFIHLSDIHFGQERGSEIVTHTDVRDRLIEDVRAYMAERKRSGDLAAATGVIITGDIAYSGKHAEYKAASSFLDRLTAAAGCQNTDVQVVPGNHDVDLKAISPGTRRMLQAVAQNGEAELDLYLADEGDRELLYARLVEYRRFANGYGCPLDDEGGHAGEKSFEFAPGRRLSFLGLNSALLCGGSDVQGKLLLGTRQRTIPIEQGVERVVLSHHPLHWMVDRTDAQRFIKTRARILMSGHEHRSDVFVEQVEDGCQFMTVEAGAANPPEVGGPYKFTYNIVEFAWDTSSDDLKVTINSRAWDDDRKRFMTDFNRFNGQPNRTYTLGCPFFRGAARPAPTPLAPAMPVSAAGLTHAASSAPVAPDAPAPRSASPAVHTREVAMTDDPYPRLRLLFFRELDRAQRLRVLVGLGALPKDLPSFPTMGVERKALDRLRDTGRLDELETALTREMEQKTVADQMKPGV
jgi:hypothetical protein